MKKRPLKYGVPSVKGKRSFASETRLREYSSESGGRLDEGVSNPGGNNDDARKVRLFEASSDGARE
jgi:hypothetical protein